MKKLVMLAALVVALLLAGCASAQPEQPALPADMQQQFAVQSAQATLTAPCTTQWEVVWVEAPVVGGIGLQMNQLIKDQPGTWEMSVSDFQELVNRLETTYSGLIAQGTELQVPLPVSNSGGEYCDGRVWNLP